MYSFPLNEGESILKKDLANLQKEGDDFNGAFYLTNERIVFVGYMGGNLNNKYLHDTQLEHIQELVPEKTFYFIKNVIKVRTIRDEQYKVIISNRDQWIKAILDASNQII